jgi:hypothetical protein
MSSIADWIAERARGAGRLRCCVAGARGGAGPEAIGRVAPMSTHFVTLPVRLAAAVAGWSVVSARRPSL